MKRQLSAILYADAVGFSGFMRSDEIRAIRSIRHHLREIGDLVEAYEGLRRGGAGDSILATFPNAHAAIHCAMAVQQRGEAAPDLFDMKFRIGVHLGDATEIDGQLLGDSVNVAARLEPLAAPGGICASSTVRDALRSEPSVRFTQAGRPSLKNMGDTLEVFHVEGLGPDGEPVSREPETGGVIGSASVMNTATVIPPSDIIQSPAVPTVSVERRTPGAVPSVAVLPFKTLSEREDLSALSDGFAEEIIGFLTRFRALDVIAPGSSIIGSLTVPHLSAQELDVRYTVNGTVRLGQRRIRVKVRLDDMIIGQTLWTESYDRTFDDIFDIQEEIAECVAASMAVHIEVAEQMLARARTPESLDAYALQLRARDEIFWNEPESRDRGLSLIRRSIDISEHYARAHAVLSRAHHLGWKYSWSDDPKESFRLAYDSALRAVEIDRSDARGQAEVGLVALYNREHDRSIRALSKALQLNPSDADIIGEYADTLKHAGRSEEALPLFERAIKLNPLHADRYRRDLAHAHLIRRDFESAVNTIEEMTDPHQALRAMTASCAHLGRMDEAKHWADILRQKYPGFSARAWASIVPDRNPDDTEMFIEGLERAGL